jgi:hypothetical protein
MDFVSARIDPMSGNVVWMHQVDTSAQGEAFLGYAAYHAVATPDTALVVFAQGNAYVNWGDGVTTDLFGTHSSVLVSNGPAGETRWARSILADNVTDDRVVSEGNAIWVSGSAFTNSAFTRFDTLNLRMPARTWVPYMAKMRLIRPPFVPQQGVGNVPGSSLVATPNPARNAIRVAGLSGRSTLTLKDMSGRIILNQETDRPDAVINVTTLPRGTYFLQFTAPGIAPQVRKVVLQ